MPDELADLLAGATERAGLDEAPGKSGATLERVVIDGQAYVLKHLDLGRDWTMRASGCLRGAPLVLWERGILAPPARLPEPADRGRGPGAARLRPADARRRPVARARHRRADPAGPARAVPASTWPHCTRPSGPAGTSSTWSRRCTATWSSRRGWRRRRPPRARRTWCRAWSRRAGRCWPRSPRPRPRSSPRWPATRVRCSRRWPRRRRRSCTVTSSSTTWAPTTQAARWCSTGSSRDAGRRCPTWPGTSRSTAAACPSPRRPRSRPTGRRWRAAASTPVPGGTASWRCACSARWSCSAGRRHSAATTRSSRGGRPESVRAAALLS